jgi:formate dehydrogenase (NADP+) beta subunit
MTTTSRSMRAIKRCRIWSKDRALGDIGAEVELGFDPELAWKEAQRCLNCDVQTVFTAPLCIECDACVDICPMDCITFTQNGARTICASGSTRPALNPTSRSMSPTGSIPGA